LSEAVAKTNERHDVGGDGAAQRPLVALLAEVPSADVLKQAAARVRDAGYTHWDAHSPFPVHGLDPQMGIRMTRLPWLVAAFGVAGCLAGLLLQWWANAANPGSFPFVPTFLQGYDFLISGKPYFSLPANVPIMFELTILLAALASGIGMLVLNDLPRYHNPIFASKRFTRVTTDAFFIRIDATDPLFEPARTRAFLRALGAVAVEEIRERPSQSRPPRAFLRAALIVGALALIPLAIVYMARASRSEDPRIHIVQDMDNQPKYRPQQAMPLFPDGRAMRPAVPGTVARGEARLDDHFYRGLVGGDYARTFPTHRPQVAISEAFIRRGQERFGIYCAPCHGLDGSGDGLVNRRATELGPWVPASDLHSDQVRQRPVGHLFNTITNGIRNMPAYGTQISEADRWAIVAYIRALQRSSRGRLDELPPELRSELKTR